jgi:hypothetical protein
MAAGSSSLPYQATLAHRDIMQRAASMQPAASRCRPRSATFEIAIFGINGAISVVPPNFVFFRQASVEFCK